MTKDEISKYYERILPFYLEMAGNEYVKALQKDDNEILSFFCTQWGRKWDGGILFVGRATNGWQPIDLHALPFNRPNQMKWVDEVWYKPEEGSSWTGTKSPFWRVIRRIASHFYPHAARCDEWYNHIAWSNLYKCSFTECGNPTKQLMYETRESCQKLLEVDFEMLKPRVVVMFTESNKFDLDALDCNWSGPFLTGFKKWGQIDGDCPLRIFKKASVCLIVSERPETRPEDIRVQTIVAAIEKYGHMRSCNTIANSILRNDVVAELNSRNNHVLWSAKGACSCERHNEEAMVVYAVECSGGEFKTLKPGVNVCCVFDQKGFEGCQVAVWQGEHRKVHVETKCNNAIRKMWHVHDDEPWLAWRGVIGGRKSKKERERGMAWDVDFFNRIQNDIEYKQAVVKELADSILELHKMLAV